MLTHLIAFFRPYERDCVAGLILFVALVIAWRFTPDLKIGRPE